MGPTIRKGPAAATETKTKTKAVLIQTKNALRGVHARSDSLGRVLNSRLLAKIAETVDLPL
jgi:hypothetical protein